MKKKKISKKESPKNSQEKLMQLNDTLDYLEKELEQNTDYIEKRLSKKWYDQDKIKKSEIKEIEKTEEKSQEAVSKENLKRLQEAANYFENKLKRNEEYIKKEIPESKEVRFSQPNKIKKDIQEKSKEKIKEPVSKENLRRLRVFSGYFENKLKRNEEYIKKEIPEGMEMRLSQLNQLNEERKNILAEIQATRKLLNSLETERIKLKQKEIKKESQSHISQMQKYEKFVGSKLKKDVGVYKTKKRKKKTMKLSRKKIHIVRPKEAVSEKALVNLQTNLDKLNQELESLQK